MGSVDLKDSVHCYRLKLFPSCITNFTKGGKCLAHIQRLSSRRGTSTKPKEQNKAALKANLSSTMPERCLRQIPVQEKQKRPRSYYTFSHCLYFYFLSPRRFTGAGAKIRKIFDALTVFCQILLGRDWSVTNDKPRKLGTCWKTFTGICLHQITTHFISPYVSVNKVYSQNIAEYFQLCLEKFSNKCDSSTQWGPSLH